MRRSIVAQLRQAHPPHPEGAAGARRHVIAGAAFIVVAGIGLFAAGAARPVGAGPARTAGPRSPARAATASPCPAGALLCEDFEDTDFAARGWYDGSRGVITAAEHAPGSGHAFECTYARGATGCEGGTPARHAFDLTDSLYVEYWVKYAPGFVGSGKPYHPHEYVFMTNKDGPYIGPAGTHLTTYVEQLAGRPRLGLQDLLNVDTRCILRNDGSFVGCDGDFDSYRFTERRSVAACNGMVGDLDQHDCFPTGNGQWYSSRVWDAPAGTTLYGGDWHRVAARFGLNSIAGGKGQVDGTLRYWLDGRLVLSYDHILYRTAANADQQFNQMLIAPYIGDGSPLRQTMWIDDLRLLRDGDGGGDPEGSPTAPATSTATSTATQAVTATLAPTVASTAVPTSSATPTTGSRPTATIAGRTLYLPLLAAPAESLVQIGQIGGRVGGVAVQGDRAFLGIGPRVVVIDLADRAHPRQVGASPVLASSVKVISIEGRYLWAGLDSGELVGLDISGADEPPVLSVLPVALQWWNSTGPLAVRGGFAYVGQTAGLVIVDLADPRAPRLVGGPVAGSARPYDIAVSGDHAYVSYYDSDDTPGGIDVFDVADPRSPRRVASLELTTGVFPVAAEGDVLAVIANRELWLIDIANPRDPRVAAVSGGQTEHPSFDIGLTNVSDMAMQGNTVWLASPDDDPLDQGGVVAIDIANLRSPRQMGQLRTLPADALALAGDTLVALGTSSGVDVSVVAAEPRAPRLEGSLRLFAGAYNLWLAGRVAFVAAYLDYLTDLQVVDLSTPSRPRYLGAIPISSNEVLRVADGEMWTRSTTAGVPRGTSLVRWGLADPLHPRALGERQLEGSTGQGVGSGDWMYVTGTTGSGATRRGGVWQVHTTDAARPIRFIGLLDASRGDSYPSAIAIADNRLVAASNDRVWIFDITDPDQVRELASFDLPGPAVSPVLVAEGHTAFVLRGFFGSRVFDLANPPRELSTAPWLPGRWYSLYGASVLGSGHLHVASSPFEVWDVREPLAPRQLPAPGGWSWTGDVAMDGRLVVVASVDGGLRVLAWR